MSAIVSVIQEGRQTFSFSDNAMASKYDEWAHYRQQFSKGFNWAKAVDILYVSDSVGWLIEVKDYRQDCQIKPSELADAVARKVHDTLSGLVSAKFTANNAEEMHVAKSVLRCSRLRIVLHVEQNASGSKLKPKIIDPALVLQKLKKLVRSVDPHPCVVDQATLRADMDWTVTG